AEHEVASFPGHGAQARLGVAAANYVVEHVDALGLREVFQPRLEVLVLVIEAVVGTMLVRKCKLLFRRGDGDDARAYELADLNRCQACTAPPRKAQQASLLA